LSLAGSPTLLAASTPEVKLKDGVQCTAKPDDAYEGETHRCYLPFCRLLRFKRFSDKPTASST
jgi:hypothetical protein